MYNIIDPLRTIHETIIEISLSVAPEISFRSVVLFFEETQISSSKKYLPLK